MKKITPVFAFSMLVAFFGIFTIGYAQISQKTEAQSLQEEQFINELLDKMTLKEKIGQMNQYAGFWDPTGPAPVGGDSKEKYEHIKQGLVGSMLNVVGTNATREAQRLAVEESRLGIPLIFGYDVIHGYQTMFPIPLGETASWNLEAIERGSAVAAAEAAAAGINWTFAPMVDISRDARWGRNMEGAGEDAFLGSQVAVARVRGFQGEDLSDPATVAACVKHFAAYGFAEAGRDYNTVDIGGYTLHNHVLPPFKAAADAGAATFMNAFNILGDTPANGSYYLQTELLKEEWGFDGFIVSDWGSVREMVAHGYARDDKEAAFFAAVTGNDMEMASALYLGYLEELVNEGKVPVSRIDDAARRILRIKYRLGLFEDPYKYIDSEREKQVIGSTEHHAIAKDMAKKSIVLLKNEQNLLPLSKSEKIVVIGELGADKDSPLGSWRAQAIKGSAVSVVEGLTTASGSTIPYAKGPALTIGEPRFQYPLEINAKDTSGMGGAILLAKSADKVIMVLGENCFLSGEGRSRVDIGLPGLQQQLLEAVYAVNKNIVLVLMNGRPLAIPWAAEHIPAIVESWHLGSESGNAIAEVLYGDYNPSGKLPVTFPRSVGQVPIYYNQRSTGRAVADPPDMVFWSHYIDEENTPQFHFGHGLSYTTFEYNNLNVAKEMVMDGQSLEISVDVQNSGAVEGVETVQLYIQDIASTVTRPVRELKGFQQVHLNPGETKTVTFTLEPSHYGFYDANGVFKTEEGVFNVFVGGSSQASLSGKFSLKK